MSMKTQLKQNQRLLTAFLDYLLSFSFLLLEVKISSDQEKLKSTCHSGKGDTNDSLIVNKSISNIYLLLTQHWLSSRHVPCSF